MQLSHTHPVRSAVFDDPSLVSSAGLVPMLALARSAGLTKLADQHLSVPTDKGANPGLKVSSLVAVMVDIDDTISEVHGYGKQGSGYGYSGVRGLNAILATVTTKDTAPVRSFL